ncbi:MAG: hypothetical protein QOF53_2164 [Nocardioidaceae bacterium]|nr:hypothetical protein [Nocardioidaceae bacterium]
MVLRRHPWAVSLLGFHEESGSGNLAAAEGRNSNFREGGFPISLAAHAVSTVGSYVQGFVLQEVNLHLRDESELAAMTAATMESSPASEFPYLFGIDGRDVLQSGYDYGNEFASGLKAVLSRITALLEQ